MTFSIMFAVSLVGMMVGCMILATVALFGARGWWVGPLAIGLLASPFLVMLVGR